MLNSKTIFKIIGSLLFIESAMMVCCLIMSIAYHESDTIPFLYSILITFLSALFLRFLGHKADNSMTKRDAYLVVSLSWIIFSFFGTFPLTIGEYVPSFTDAYFETMSGFTTTGATIINNVDILPHGILFWRSMTHWIGGLGIVFFTTAILPSFVGGSVKIFAAESTGPIHSRLHPRLSTSAKWIWTVYLVITIACSISFMVCGMGWFDSINYAMGTTATGGFSTHNSSIAFFHSSAIEYVGAFFCFLSGINFTLIYTSAINKTIKTIFKSSEFRFYSFITLIFSLFVIYQLIKYNGYDIEHAIRSGIFQVVSFITTTGLFSDDANKWPHITWIILTICMFLGACSGSTSGGFKSIRSVIIIKMIKNEFKQILHPNAVLPIHVDGANITHQKCVTLISFLSIYLLICLISVFIILLYGIDPMNSITMVLSSIGNVGPTIGRDIGATSSWVTLPTAIKWLCSALMLIGRLEIFTVLVIFTPTFWKHN